MTFANEVRDFIAGYTAVRETGQKDRQLDISEKTSDAQIKYQEAILDLRNREFELTSQKYRDSLERSGRAAAEAARAMPGAAATPSTAVTDAEGRYRAPNTSAPLSFGVGLNPAPEQTQGETQEETRVYRRGGLVQKADTGGLIRRSDNVLVAPAPSAAIADELYMDGPVGVRYLEPADVQNPEPVRPQPSLEQGVRPGSRRNPSVDILSPVELLQGVGLYPGDTGRDVIPRSGRNPELDRSPDLPVPPAATDEVEQARRAAPESPPPPSDDPREQARRALPDRHTPAAGSDERERARRASADDLAPTRIVIGRAAEAAYTVMGRQEELARAGRTAVGVGSDPNAPNLVTGQGAFSPQELEAIYQAIDPNGSIPQYMQSAAALAEAYTYYIERGETEKAYNIATRIIAGERYISQMLGTLAMESLQNGDPEAALRLIGDAAKRFPTGHDIVFDVGEDGILQYAVRDDGKVIEQGTLTGSDLMQLTGAVANGSLYMKEMMLFAESYKPKQPTNNGKAIDDAVNTYTDATSRMEQAAQMISLARLEDEVDPDFIAGWQAEYDDAKKTRDSARSSAINDYGARRTDFDAAVKMAQQGAISYDTMTELQPPPVRESVGYDGGTGGDGTSAGNAPAGIPPVSERVVGKVYEIGDGRKAIWRGTGWELVE